MLNVLITGAGGQLGQALCRLAAVSPNNYLATDAAELDITDREAVEKTVAERKIDVIINCAAYTDVERAEEDEAAADRINREAAANLAAAAARYDALLIHVSTDYVFDGKSCMPYREEDPTAPQNAYGRTKRAGEEAVVASGCRYLILRTAWLYSETGKNFLRTMLRLTAERETLDVVCDQVGTPTYAGDLALAIFSIVENGLHAGNEGIYHSPTKGSARGTTSPSRSPRQPATTAAASAPAAPRTTLPRPHGPPGRCSTNRKSASGSASKSPIGANRCSTACNV